MLSGLYGDLPVAKNKASSGSSEGGWAQKPKFAPPVRKASLGPPRVLSNLNKKRGEGEGKQEDQEATKQSTKIPTEPHAVLGHKEHDPEYKDKYDPGRPNEYESVRKEREKDRQEAQQEADRQEQLKMAEEVKAQEGQMRSELSAEDRQAALSVSGEEAFLRRGRLSKPGTQLDMTAADASSSAAQRMMEKMGWKEGLGLGRSHQGITTPLQAQKTDHRSAVIINADPKSGDLTPADKKPRLGASIEGSPSRVILLKNIVGPGEVDETLEDEIGEECSKYGEISCISIFEVTQPGYPPEEAVRIFVQFERMESAMKALIDLEGRFFGGRNIRAIFYADDKFENQDLAPVQGRQDAA